ncbi:protein mono-ADP-ribosyltransferase PARP10 isoform X1 [Grus americana]|uniref:protein mono-ADP-ribosyltransferase PARP10 isoform X1 n=1 Tax=Grus americana TaxID=9117 RepID=UPI0024080E63|nr:protein mono-ADP-ribosyltransferase PARP10 isoform X1 [Grus americana]
MAERVLEVGGVPPGTEEEVVVLYFESRRHSGGGPVQSCQRLGPLFFLTFESPRDAQNVLARGTHRLGGSELGVRPAPPWDPTCLLLRGLGPLPPPELLEPHLEPLLGRPRGAFGLCRGPAPSWALLRLRDPITPQEFAAAEQRVQRRGLEGVTLALLRLPQTTSVLVRAEAPGLSRDLLELYFENRRSGGGSVQAVRLLPGGQAAVVTFQEPAAAERVLQRPHRLQDVALALAPHYPFLESLDGDVAPPPDADPSPDTATLPDTAAPPRTAPPDTFPSPGTAPLPDAAPPAPAGPNACPEVAEPAEPQALSPVPGEPRAAFPGGDEHTERDEDVAGRRQEQAVLAALAQDEALVPAEPGALRYLQRHYQDLLASIPEVSLLPLEGEDIAGLRVRGETGRCRAAADFLQSLLGTVGSQTVTLRYPGIARFLRDEGGQSILRQLESRFQCVIDLDGVHWSPPDPQPELVELLPPSCRRGPLPAVLRSRHPHPLDDADGAADGDGLHSHIEEIKELLAVLRTDDGEPALQAGDILGNEQGPSAEPLTAADGEVTGETLPGEQGAGREEEEAQMVLAIQRSMDSTRREEEELARATALSLRSYHEEQRAAPGTRGEEEEKEEEEDEEDAGLLAALEASLEEALPAADAAQVTLFSSFERDVAAVPRELEQALEGRLRAEEVESDCLRALPAACRRCLTFLQRKHAVRLCLRDGTATLSGFAEYTAAAAGELALLLQRLPQPERGPPAAACWVRWDPSGTAVPYSAEASALLERAWLCRERRLDLLLDGRPFTIDFERMEEYDIGNACAVAISRSQPPTESARRLLGLEALGLEEEVRLMPLAEDSEEFCDTVRHFYETLEELHGKISIVKVEKLIHPLLYKQYQLKKASMEKACAGGAVEQILFHGTTEISSREICLHGFNRSFCGKNAALYGLGVYFAVQAAVSVQEQYSPCSADGSKYVFVAKVLTGQYAVGAQGLRAPPLREGAGAPLRYDSVVDNPLQPAIFVIFNDTQAYPQYLITCRRRGGPP